MQTHTNNLRAGREPSYKRIGPWANHDRRIVVDKHNVDTGVGEYAMRILPDADERLCPKAQKIVRKVCGNWEFPIVRDNRPLMCFKIHRSPKSHRIAVLPTSYLGLLASDGNPKVIGSSFGLVPTNALGVIEEPDSRKEYAQVM